MPERILQVRAHIFILNVKAIIYSQIQNVFQLTVKFTPVSSVFVVTLVQKVVLSGGYLVIREELSHVWKLEDQIKFHYLVPWWTTKCWNIPHHSFRVRESHLST
jgi:hypothetical protein